MNFTRPVNASSETPPAKDASRGMGRLWRWIKKGFKISVYTLLIFLILGGVALFFAPKVLSQPWVKPLYAKAMAPFLEEGVELEVEEVQLSWWEDQVLRNVRFYHATPSEEREIFIRECVIKGGLLAFAPWQQTAQQLRVEATGVEVVRTPREAYYTYRLEHEEAPLTSALALFASAKDLRLYPFGRAGACVHFDTATLSFASPSEPLAIKGEGRVVAARGEALGAFQAQATLTSLNAFRTYSFAHAATTPLQRAYLRFDGPLGEGVFELVGHADQRFPSVQAQGSCDVAKLLSMPMFASWRSPLLQSVAGRCAWTMDGMVSTATEVHFRTTWTTPPEAPLVWVYDGKPYTLQGRGTTKVTVPMATPRQLQLTELSLALPLGHLDATATVTSTSLETKGTLTANLATLWQMEAMAGLRAEGVQLQGQGVYPFTYKGPLTFDRTRLFEQATATLHLCCDTLVLPEMTLPKITFDLALKDAMLHCKGDFSVRERPFALTLPMAELFAPTPLDSNTLRAYFPQIKGTP